MRFVPHPRAVKLKSLSNQSNVIKPLPAALAPFAHLKIRGLWRVPLADTTAVSQMSFWRRRSPKFWTIDGWTWHHFDGLCRPWPPRLGENLWKVPDRDGPPSCENRGSKNSPTPVPSVTFPIFCWHHGKDQQPIWRGNEVNRPETLRHFGTLLEYLGRVSAKGQIQTMIFQAFTPWDNWHLKTVEMQWECHQFLDLKTSRMDDWGGYSEILRKPPYINMILNMILNMISNMYTNHI